MASFDEIVSKMTAAIKGVREAVLGKDVREFIASGYESVLDAYKQLNTAVDSAANSAEKAKTAITEAIDPTLSVPGKAADAAKVGEIKEDLDTERKRIDTLNEGGLNLKDEVIDTSIKAWLEDHPEATTTVQDNAITEEKINADFLPYIKNDYVTPEMFGAVGDGTTDDSQSLQKAINYVASNNKILKICKTYFCSSRLIIPNGNTNIIGIDPRKSIIKFENHNGVICTPEKNGDCFFRIKNLMIKGDGGTGVLYEKISHCDLLENCIITGFDICVSMGKCYICQIKNTIINESEKYGIYINSCTTIKITGGGISGAHGISYYEKSGYNNTVISCDISAYSVNEVDYAMLIENCFGNKYFIYYEGSHSSDFPLKAGICFKTCICCDLDGGSVTNTGTKPAIQLLDACKNIKIQNIYFNISSEFTSGSIGIEVNPTVYQCVIKNCVYNGFETAIDIKENTRVFLENLDTFSRTNSILSVTNNESVHLRLCNVSPFMLPNTLVTESNVDIETLSNTYYKNYGNTQYRNSIPTDKLTIGTVYFNTQLQCVQIFIGGNWIDLNKSI